MRRAEPSVLDIGCGTADLSLELARLGPVVGCDFSHPMLKIGRGKIANGNPAYPIALLEADALNLPFRDHSFDVVASAFVLRNLANMQKGLEEMKRVLRPGGVASILDFGLPKAALVRRPYLLYFNRVLPRLGRMFSGVDGPYKYLPDSVQLFPKPEELSATLKRAGFREISFRSLSGGIAVLFHARG
jgi:demethylmenaquinone methyltransferase/2-methoxy-6-polyprenyl-1,4-benzoquinol methylase